MGAPMAPAPLHPHTPPPAPRAERAQEFQAAYHAACDAMKELVGEPGFVEVCGAGGNAQRRWRWP